jgi:hypothetical protein
MRVRGAGGFYLPVMLPAPFLRLVQQSVRNMSSSSAAVNLVSVNTAPDRAKKVIGAVIEEVKDRYALVHAGNSESECVHKAGLERAEKGKEGLISSHSAIEGVKPLLLSVQPPPGILVSDGAARLVDTQVLNFLFFSFSLFSSVLQWCVGLLSRTKRVICTNHSCLVFSSGHRSSKTRYKRLQRTPSQALKRTLFPLVYRLKLGQTASSSIFRKE